MYDRARLFKTPTHPPSVSFRREFIVRRAWEPYPPDLNPMLQEKRVKGGSRRRARLLPSTDDNSDAQALQQRFVGQWVMQKLYSPGSNYLTSFPIAQ
jgi:hypothetical protein